MEAEQARTRSEAEHRKTAANYNSCISHMRQLEKKLKRSINKSRSVPLFLFHFPLLGPRCAWVCWRMRKRGSAAVIWCSPDVWCIGCAMSGCAPRRKSKGMRLLTMGCSPSSDLIQWQMAVRAFSSSFSSFFLPLQAVFWTEGQVLSAAGGMHTVIVCFLDHFRVKTKALCWATTLIQAVTVNFSISMSKYNLLIT